MFSGAEPGLFLGYLPGFYGVQFHREKPVYEPAVTISELALSWQAIFSDRLAKPWLVQYFSTWYHFVYLPPTKMKWAISSTNSPKSTLENAHGKGVIRSDYFLTEGNWFAPTMLNTRMVRAEFQRACERLGDWSQVFMPVHKHLRTLHLDRWSDEMYVRFGKLPPQIFAKSKSASAKNQGYSSCTIGLRNSHSMQTNFSAFSSNPAYLICFRCYRKQKCW